MVGDERGVEAQSSLDSESSKHVTVCVSHVTYPSKSTSVHRLNELPVS